MLLIFDSLIKKRRPLFFLPPSALARLSHPALSPPGSRPPLVLILLVLAPARSIYDQRSHYSNIDISRLKHCISETPTKKSNFFYLLLHFFSFGLNKGEIKAHKTKPIK